MLIVALDVLPKPQSGPIAIASCVLVVIFVAFIVAISIEEWLYEKRMKRKKTEGK